MAGFTRTLAFAAFQFNLHDGGSDAEVFFQRELIARGMPELNVYDLDVSQHYEYSEDGDRLECRMTVVQHRVDDSGERSNITHVLRPGEWLLEDHTAEGGCRVMAQEDFAAIDGLQEA